MEQPRVLLDLNNFSKAQKLFQAVLSDQYRAVFYGGAVRGGKSYNMLAALAVLLKRYPGSRAVIVRRDMTTLIRNTLPTCMKVFPSSLKLVNRSRYVWQLENDEGFPPSTVFFFGENYNQDKELARWDGLEVNFIVLDQIEELQYETLVKSFERCGSYVIPGRPTTDQPLPIIMASCNPTSNWVKRVIYDRYVDHSLPKDWVYIPSKIWDNPHVPQSYIDGLEQLRNIDPFEYRRRVEGVWEIRHSDLMLYEPDAIQDLFTNDFVEAGNKYITADIALDGSDRFVIMVWDGWRCIDVSYHDVIQDSNLVAKLIREKAIRYKVPASRIVYDADGVGLFLKGQLRGAHAFRNNGRPLAQPGTRRVDAGRRVSQAPVPMYANLKTQCYYGLRQKINFREMLIQCPPQVQDWIIEELSAIERKEKETAKLSIKGKDDIRAIINRSPDFADCLAMRYYFELVKPRRLASGSF